MDISWPEARVAGSIRKDPLSYEKLWVGELAAGYNCGQLQQLFSAPFESSLWWRNCDLVFQLNHVHSFKAALLYCHLTDTLFHAGHVSFYSHQFGHFVIEAVNLAVKYEYYLI